MHFLVLYLSRLKLNTWAVVNESGTTEITFRLRVFPFDMLSLLGTCCNQGSRVLVVISHIRIALQYAV